VALSGTANVCQAASHPPRQANRQATDGTGKAECREANQYTEQGERRMTIGKCYYFGCQNETGHFLWDEQNRKVYSVQGIPFRWTILDGALLPPDEPETEGLAEIVHVGSWTIITFWDRSVDKRGGCSSAFVIPAHLWFDEATAIAKERFPRVWARFAFDIKSR